MSNNSITIAKVFWSVPNLKFADNILFSVLKIKKTKSSGPNFNTYILPNKTEIIAFVEKRDFKIYDSSIHFFLPTEKIIKIQKIINEMGYDNHVSKSKKYDIVTLSCFAPSPHKYCEVTISNSKG